MMGWLKALERWGRRMLVWCVGACFGVRHRAIQLGETPRIVVVRLDERIGNLLLLTPLLDALRGRFPQATLDVVVNERGVAVLRCHDAVNGVWGFRKRALWHRDGPVGVVRRLRRGGYDLAIDASNPTDPSVTHGLVVRLSAARHTIGAQRPGFGRFFSCPVSIPCGLKHEIDLRLALLSPLLERRHHRLPRLGCCPRVPSQSGVGRWLAQVPRPFGVVNVGARVLHKRLDASGYAHLLQAMWRRGLTPVLTFGPHERSLAEEAVVGCPTAALAPPTSVLELAAIFSAATVVISCDTGPMHLSVATATPTLGIFVSTSPQRYGYDQSPHGIIDARNADGVHAWLPQVACYLEQQDKKANEDTHGTSAGIR